MKPFLLILLILAIESVHAKSNVVHVAKTGFIVENSIESKQPVDKVWTALVTNVDSWWPKDHSWWGLEGKLTIDAKAGGCFCEIAGEKSAEHMHISFVDPGKLLRMTGGLGPLQGMGMYGALDWVINRKDGITIVTLTYRVNGIHPDGFEKLAPIVAKVQGIQLNGLKTYLENNH